MKILIKGYSGQLGKAFKEVAGEDFEIVVPNKKQLNLSNFNKCFSYVEDNKPDILLNFAAYTNVDEAEGNSKYAYAVNAEAPKAFSMALKNTGGNLLQISTDYVFDGKQNIPYSIYQKPNPINLYGKSKLKGEKFINEIIGDNKQSIILRTSWLMSPFGNNFAMKMLKLHKCKNEIAVVADQVGTPTSAHELAKVCLLLIKNWSKLKEDKSWENNILHWSDQGIASWYDVAFFVGEIATSLGLIDKPALVKPIKSSQFKTLAKRPNFSVLDCFESRRILKYESIHWKEGIFNLIKSIHEKNLQLNEKF